ncbi:MULTISPECIES: cell envelope integrity EipB family protein [unclassified Afipia]|uniref:cell envelope integrity EipB family protein n=1 Tax=unclassified Afipia TaxID=2642050 RepID=UPI000428DEAF|nr:MULTISPECIES: cell envelope integrity EipB family protein [unclassified Afipia]
MRRARRISGYGLAALSAVFLASASGGAHAAPSVAFLAHQAVYDLSLKTSRGNASVSNARGRILYNFAGSSCEGYTTEFRQVSQLDTGENKTTLSDLRSTSWEDGEGKSYRFKIETRMNDTDTTSIDGMAERDGKTIKVKLKKPKAKTFTIEGAVFPTEQVRRIIEAAREGKSLLELVVYDGSDDGEKVYNTLTVIGQPIPGTKAPAKPDAASANEKFKSQTRWPVTVSYYDRAAKSNSGEQTPVYAMSFELYEDGVSRALSLDYNDFVIAGAMDKIDIKETKPCK